MPTDPPPHSWENLEAMSETWHATSKPSSGLGEGVFGDYSGSLPKIPNLPIPYVLEFGKIPNLYPPELTSPL